MKYIKVLLLLSLFFIENELSVLGVSVTLSRVLTAALFVYIIFSMIKSRESIKSFFYNNKISLIYLVYILVFFMIIIYDFNGSVISIFKYLSGLIVAFITFISFYYEGKDELSYDKYLTVLLVVATIIILVGLITVPTPVIGPKRFDSLFWGRSNRMTTRFLLLLPAAFFLAKNKSKWYYIFFYTLILGICMTISRAGMAVVLGFIALNIFEFIKKENIIITISGFLIDIFVLFQFKYLQSFLYRYDVLKDQISNEIVRNGAQNGSAHAATSSISRIQIWNKAWSNFKEHPILGIGIDKFKTYYINGSGVPTAETNAHNWILHILAETGIVGLTITLVLIISLLVGLYKLYSASRLKNDKNTLYKSIIGFWALMLFLIHNLAEASSNALMFGSGNVTILLIIILAICLSKSKNKLYD